MFCTILCSMLCVDLLSADLLKSDKTQTIITKNNNPNEEAFRRAVRNFAVDSTLTCTIIFMYEGFMDFVKIVHYQN